MNFFDPRFDPHLWAGINAAEQELQARLDRQERARIAQDEENRRAELAAEEQHRKNQELIRPRVLPAWKDPLAKGESASKVDDLIQRVQDRCGEVLLLTISMLDQTAHNRAVTQLLNEVRADAKKRLGANPTRVATNDILCKERYTQLYREQEEIVRNTAGAIDRKAKERIRTLSPAPMNGQPWREGMYAPFGYRPSQEVLDARYPPDPVLRVTDYFPPRAPGFIPKVVVKKDGDVK